MKRPAAYYNEIDPYCAQWLRNLIAAGHIAPGDVDDRSITEVKPDDIRGYTQCHFFAGIGGWSFALRLAGWPDDRPVWTGSCPCQPFSAAGKQRGSEDERHLWPSFFDLIRECRPASVFGEQVAGASGYAWWDHVAADLESEGYAAAAADIGAHSVGAPHLRQRLYWVADANSTRSGEQGRKFCEKEWGQVRGLSSFAGQPGEGGWVAHAANSNWWLGECRAEATTRSIGIGRVGSVRCCSSGAVADHDARGRAIECAPRLHAQREPGHDVAGRGANGGMGDSCGAGPQEQWRRWIEPARPATAGALDGAWADIAWIHCSDGKARPTQPGLFPLAHGIPNRVGRLRAYGNAIVPQVAAAFVIAARP